MKSNAIIVSLLACISTAISACHAQLIDNKINVCAEYLTGAFHGKKLIQENEFLYPSFYSNLKDFSGFSAKLLYKSHQHISWGMGVSFCKASNWQYADHLDYESAEVNMRSVSPTVQFHTKFSGSGIFNRCRIFLEVAPVVGVSSITLAKPVFQIESSGNEIPVPLRSDDSFYGVMENVGFEWAFTQSAGLVMSYSLRQQWISSMLYSDTYFTNSHVNMGITLKLAKDKRFPYRK